MQCHAAHCNLYIPALRVSIEGGVELRPHLEEMLEYEEASCLDLYFDLLHERLTVLRDAKPIPSADFYSPRGSAQWVSDLPPHLKHLFE